MTTGTTERGHREGRARRRPHGSRIRADVQLSGGGSYQRYFSEWPEVATWIASPGYLSAAPGISSVRLIHLAGQPGGAQ